MSSQDLDLERLTADLALKEKRARKRHLAYTLMALLAGTLWLAYSFYEVGNLRRETQDLKEQIKQQSQKLGEINGQLKNKNAELASVAEALHVPLEDLQNLEIYGIKTGNENGMDLRSFKEQSDKAMAELKNIKSTTGETSRRAGISIHYYVRGSDHNRVVLAMDTLQKDYGFRIVADEKKKEPNTYTNAIWLNRPGLKEEDIKLVAYYLIRHGVQIKYLGPPTSKPERARKVSSDIMVVAEPNAKDEPSLTVEKIRDLSLDAMTRGTKTLKW